MASQLPMTFDRVVCINLKRRAERWEAFLQHMASVGWPFGPVERVEGIDGELVPAPAWFDVDEADYTWGCLRSHLRIWEDAINDRVESLLILEDDAILCDDFVAQAKRFLNQVPSNWELLFLGGHHVPGTVPLRVSEQVFQPEACWRTHCYALRGNFIRTLYRHVCQFNAPGRFSYRDAHHVDHQIGDLMQKHACHAYCPPRWLSTRQYLSGYNWVYTKDEVTWQRGLDSFGARSFDDPTRDGPNRVLTPSPILTAGT